MVTTESFPSMSTRSPFAGDPSVHDSASRQYPLPPPHETVGGGGDPEDDAGATRASRTAGATKGEPVLCAAPILAPREPRQARELRMRDEGTGKRGHAAGHAARGTDNFL